MHKLDFGVPWAPVFSGNLGLDDLAACTGCGFYGEEEIWTEFGKLDLTRIEGNVYQLEIKILGKMRTITQQVRRTGRYRCHKCRKVTKHLVFGPLASHTWRPEQTSAKPEHDRNKADAWLNGGKQQRRKVRRGVRAREAASRKAASDAIRSPRGEVVKPRPKIKLCKHDLPPGVCKVKRCEG